MADSSDWTSNPELIDVKGSVNISLHTPRLDQYEIYVQSQNERDLQFSIPEPPPPKRRKKSQSHGTFHSGYLDSLLDTNTLLSHGDQGSCSHRSDSVLSIEEDEDMNMAIPSMDEFIIPEMMSNDFMTPDMMAELDNSSELYQGSTVTVFQAVSTLLSWFAAFPGMSKSSFGRLLTILHTIILPKGNVLPTSYREAVRLLNPYMSPVKEYHCCVNDCMIYRDSSRGNYEKLSKCPFCNEDRFQPQSKIPRKRFKYLPLETRIRRLFSNPKMSQLLQAHYQLDSFSLDFIDSIHQSEAWKSWYGASGIFKGDCRALSFGICMDGLNPYAHEKTAYSTCPISLIILNLPHHLRNLSGSMLLTGLIPGPKEPKNTDPYVDVLVDDVMSLNKLQVYDAHKEEFFQLKANILLHIFDYPGQNKVLHCQGAGAYAGCAYCCLQGEYCSSLDKIVYLQHRSFLPDIDVLRIDEHFPSSSVPVSPPEMKTMSYIDKQNGKLSAVSTAKERKTIIKESGCTGSYSLRSLPHHDRHLNTPVEPMHVLKNIAERIVKLLSGLTDTIKVRMAEKNINRFRDTWPSRVLKNGKEIQHLPSSPFSLHKKEIEVANSRALHIKAPIGYDWKPCHLFGKTAGHLNSNQWKHVLSSGILKFCIRGLLGQDQRKTLTELSNVIHLLCAESVQRQLLDSLEYRVHRVLSLLERDFPMTIHVITVHLLHHLPMYIRRFGPTYGFWMYPMERFNSWISRRILNRRFPEATVIETYRLFELTFFLQMSGQLPSGSTTDVIPHDHNLDDDSATDELGLIGTDELPQVHGSSSTLEPSEISELSSFYQKQYPDYKAVLSTYKKERDQAKKSHKLKKFPPLSAWSPEDSNSLTPNQLKLRDGPSDEIIQYRVYTVRDKRHRLITFKTMEGEQSNSIHVSSYVQYCSRHENNRTTKVFGRIKRIFCHKFNGNEHNLVQMQWYKPAKTDQESGLMYCSMSLNTSVPSILPLSELSRPLIHAIDGEDPGKLWILIVHDHSWIN